MIKRMHKRYEKSNFAIDLSGFTMYQLV